MKSKWQLAVLGASVLVVLVWAVSSLQKRTAPGSQADSSESASAPRMSETAQATFFKGVSQVQEAATSHDLQQMLVLEQILMTKNDNDPRMDTELRDLSPAAKKLMEEKYHALPLEKRNQRGTIVFLIGRDLSSAEDVAFLGSVLSEPPCLSLSDCSREDKQGQGSEAHEDVGSSVTLAYPPMVALSTLEQQVSAAEQGKKSGQLDGIRRVIDDASHSPISMVSEKAKALQDRLKNLHG